MTTNTAKKCAVVFGVDETGGVAAAIARRAGKEGLHVHVVGHRQEPLNDVAAMIQRTGGTATAVTLETSDSRQIDAFFQRISKQGYQPALVTHGGGRFSAQTALDTPVAEMEAQWRRLCLAGCLIGQAAIPRMLAARQGTLLFLGHSSALSAEIPAATGAAAFAAAGAGLRSFTQSMAREFGPKNIHVAHVVLYDAADNASPLNPDAVAESCWQIHRQHKTTWTQELDLRPYH